VSGVDVLAVMDDVANNILIPSGGSYADELSDARAAVAELITTATEVAKYSETLCVGGVDIGSDLIAALVRVTGGAE